MPFRSRSTILATILAGVLAASCGSSSNGPTPPPPPPTDGNPFDGTAILGPAGGTVTLGEGISLEIPAGALSEDTEITITRVATPADLQAAGAIGQAYRIAPVDLTLNPAARVGIFVPDAVIAGRPIASLTILRSTTGNADLAPAGGLVPASEELGNVERTGGAIVSGTTNQLGTFSAAATEEPNQAPTANAGPDQTVEVGDQVSLSGSGNDPDGDPLTFSWAFQSRPQGSAASLSNAGSATPSFTADVAGTYVVVLTVSDGNGGTDTDTVEIVAEEPPAGSVNANAGPDQTVSVGQNVQLDGRGSTGENLTYLWSQVSGPSNVTIQNAAGAQASFTPPVAGTYVLRLRVSNGTNEDTDTVTITVSQPNRPPTVTLNAPNAVFLGAQATVQATVSDPDGNPVSLSFTLQAPQGSAATLQVNGNQASFTPDVAGQYTVQATVNDGTVQTSANATVFGNLMVAGTYTTEFRVTNISGNCGGFINVGDVATAEMQVTQPNPGTVVLQLSAFDNLNSNASGTLQGTNYAFNGQLTLTDGGNPPTNIQAQGTITGTFSANPMGLNLVANFSALGVCQATATMISPP